MAAPFVENIVLSLFEWSWLLCQKSVGYRCMGSFLDSQFYSLNMCFCPNSSTTMLWLLLSCSKLGNWKVWVLQLFFFKVVLATLSSFHFYVNFRISLWISAQKKKKQLNFNVMSEFFKAPMRISSPRFSYEIYFLLIYLLFGLTTLGSQKVKQLTIIVFDKCL